MIHTHSVHRPLGARSVALPLVLLTALGAGACKRTPEPVEEDTSGSEAPVERANREVTLTPPDDTPTGAAECAIERVYFQYDSDALTTRSRDAIRRSVACYRENGMPTRLHLTGATDPRGTEEYNIALGDRRAQAVRAYLVALGIDEQRVSVSSMGEELAEGDDEAGWARDRHVSAAE